MPAACTDMKPGGWSRARDESDAHAAEAGDMDALLHRMSKDAGIDPAQLLNAMEINGTSKATSGLGGDFSGIGIYHCLL